MKALMIFAAVSAALALAACDEPYQQEAETAPPPPVDLPMAPSATDQTAPVADATAPTTAPSTTTLPADERTSEQSVKPESETLFY